MPRPLIFADFNNADVQGRVRLNCVGTIRDLAQKRVPLTEGLLLTLTDDELEADGQVYFNNDEQGWVAVIDWQAIRPHSDPRHPEPATPIDSTSAAITSAPAVP